MYRGNATPLHDGGLPLAGGQTDGPLNRSFFISLSCFIVSHIFTRARELGRSTTARRCPPLPSQEAPAK